MRRPPKPLTEHWKWCAAKEGGRAAVRSMGSRLDSTTSNSMIFVSLNSLSLGFLTCKDTCCNHDKRELLQRFNSVC